MADVGGHCDSRFEPVREALADELNSGNELGASLAVDVEGKAVVDLWGGWRDADQSRPWDADTITNVWSMTKTVTNLCALMLIDRGELDPYEPVAKYWPEFGEHGKECIDVRHILSHTSGVAGWEPPFSIEQLYDWDYATSRLASQAAWWQPGSASGYHGDNQGHLIGELIRRVTGKGLREFVADEIAGPLGADFQIGAREADWSRIAPIVPPEMDLDEVAKEVDGLDHDSPMYKTIVAPGLVWDPAVANTPEWRRAELGALNGHANARSVAQVLRVLALGGETAGIKLVSPDVISLVFEEQSHGVDLVLGIPVRWGIGYALPETESVPYVPQGRACYWGGWGGSLSVMDLDNRTTISYVMNRMGAGTIGSERTERYFRTIISCLGG